MNRIELAQITKRETSEYILLLERLLALRSLKIILKNNVNVRLEANISDDSLFKINEFIKTTYKNMDKWWDFIDEKYILIHNEDRELFVDFNENKIYSINKIDNENNRLVDNWM